MNFLPSPKTCMLKCFLLSMACMLVLNVTAQDWKWVNPAPTGNQLNCVKMVDASIAYAVGNYGTILTSTNGGIHWKLQISNTVSNLSSISAIDKDTVYVSGRDLSVLKTTDGGTTWRTVRQGSGSDRNKSKLYFFNATIGFLLGDGLEELFKTTDAGTTWTKLPTELNFQGITSLYFTSADTGYTSGSNNRMMLKTTDGGAHWTDLSLPLRASYNAVVFTDRQTGYLIGNSGEIVKTQDAGKTWQIQNMFPSSLTNSSLLSICFADQNTGFITGGKEILKTSDGGHHWKVIARPAFDVRSVSFADTLHGISVGGDWLHEYAGITTTSDGGLNWNEQSTTLTDRYIHRIKFVNDSTGYAVGGNTNTNGGFILKTTDTGNTWSTINTGLDNYYINDLALPDEKTIYTAGVSGQVLKSTDAGATWKKQNIFTTETLNAVCFVNAQTGYVVGDNQTIFKTSNGGTSWTKQSCPKTKHNYSAWFKDVNTGYIVSYDWETDSCTLLLSTTNGGLSWKSRHIGTMRYPSRITFVNKDTAFIAGDFGAILKTTDGGMHWSPTYLHGNSYYDLFFISENTGYVIGEDGEISMTENCGKNWTVLDSGTDKDLLSIFFTDANTGIAVGSNGIILKTTNSGSSLKRLRQRYYDICPGTQALVEPNFIGGKKPLSFLWSNAETTPAISVTGVSSTRYQVTVTDADQDTIQMTVPVNVPMIPAPVIRMQNDTLFSNADYGNHWFRNDTIVQGAYSDYFVPTSVGDYYCVVYDYNCHSEPSNVIQFDTSSVPDISVNELQAYPNPVTSRLTIERSRNSNDCLLTLTDAHGKEITRLTTSEKKINLEMGDLPKGIYLIQLKANDVLWSKKILKE